MPDEVNGVKYKPVERIHGNIAWAAFWLALGMFGAAREIASVIS